MTGKTCSIILVTFLSLLLSTEASFSQVYTWVDESGNKHFGDSVPEKYSKKSKTINLKEPNTTPIRKSNNSISGILGEPKTVKRNKPRVKKKAPSKAKTKQSDCSVQFAKYKDSIRCFSACMNTNGGINRTKCAHCTNVRRPRCNQVY